MDIESLREYCLSMPYVTEDTAFGEDCLLLRVFDKIFACIALDRNDYVSLKCEPEYAIELRDKYSDIEPAFHWNKRHWNQLRLSGTLQDELVKHLIRHSYCQVVNKLPKKLRTQYPSITEVHP